MAEDFELPQGNIQIQRAFVFLAAKSEACVMMLMDRGNARAFN
jgi:hypothetical protein